MENEPGRGCVGIVNGLLMSIPFWGAVILVLWLWRTMA